MSESPKPETELNDEEAKAKAEAERRYIDALEEMDDCIRIIRMHREEGLFDAKKVAVVERKMIKTTLKMLESETIKKDLDLSEFEEAALRAGKLPNYTVYYRLRIRVQNSLRIRRGY